MDVNKQHLQALVRLGVLALALGCGDKDPEALPEEGDGDNPREDRDGDGHDSWSDCDDSDPSIHPGATETCNEEDDDCDGAVDEGLESWFYLDADGDGYGDPAERIVACSLPAGASTDHTDCDDQAADVHPGADEYCDAVDHDCDGDPTAGAVDPDTFYADEDGDGFGAAGTGVHACEAPDDHVPWDTDCDDSSRHIYPGAPVLCMRNADSDCDPGTPTDGMVTWWTEGVPLDVSADFAGTDGAPAQVWVDSDSHFDVCTGTYFVQLSVDERTFAQVSAADGPGTVVFDGGGTGPVLRVDGSLAELYVVGLDITGGLATATDAEGNTLGGGIFCDGDSVVELEQGRLLGNAGDLGAGGAATDQCHLSLVDTVASGNTGSRGPALAATDDARLSVWAGSIEDHTATEANSAALSISASTLDLDGVDFSGNQPADVVVVDTGTQLSGLGAGVSLGCDATGCR